jgi:hypothetical protein
MDYVYCTYHCLCSNLSIEHLTYFWNVSIVTWNAFSVIWNASRVNTIHVPVKGELERVLSNMLNNLKGPLKLNGELNILLISGETCLSKGLLIDTLPSIYNLVRHSL